MLMYDCNFYVPIELSFIISWLQIKKFSNNRSENSNYLFRFQLKSYINYYNCKNTNINYNNSAKKYFVFKLSIENEQLYTIASLQ